MRRVVLALHRVRMLIFVPVAAVLIAHALFGRLLPDEVRPVRLAILWTAVAVVILCVLLSLLAPRLLPDRETRVVRAPVAGRWSALNSPASSVPSHGVRAYGQAYAIDLVAEAEGEGQPQRPAFGGEAFRLSSEYPAFGRPVHAMIDGTVVTASGWRRDHRARSNGWALIWMMVEGAVREIGGPGFVIGNHVTIRGDDGTYALVAHLQRASLDVRRGDRVTAGQRIARCGNSGNSSEPHVHAQLMDRRSPWTGQGVPMAFAAVRIDDEHPADALPANGQHLLA